MCMHMCDATSIICLITADGKAPAAPVEQLTLRSVTVACPNILLCIVAIYCFTTVYFYGIHVICDLYTYIMHTHA